MDFKSIYKNVCKLPQKSPSTVQFFAKNDNSQYVIYDSDAELVSSIIFNSRPDNYFSYNSDNVYYLAINNSMFNRCLKELLLNRQMRIELFSVSSGVSNDLTLESKASPGNLDAFEDILFKDKIPSNILLCIHIKNNMVSIAYCDNTDYILGIGEYMDDSTQLQQTASVIYQLNPCECLLIYNGTNSGNKTEAKLAEILTAQNVLLVSDVRLSDSSFETLQDFIHGDDSDMLRNAQLKYPIPLRCVQTILNYKNAGVNFRSVSDYRLNLFDHQQFIHIDKSVIKAFSLFPNPSQPSVQKESTLFGLIDNCQTTQGQRLLTTWIKQPLKQVHHIEERLNLVSCFVGQDQLCRDIQKNHLKTMPDFARFFLRFQKNKATLKDCVKIYYSVKQIGMLMHLLENRNFDEHSNLINEILVEPLKLKFRLFMPYIELIDKVVDLNSSDDSVDQDDSFLKSTDKKDNFSGVSTNFNRGGGFRIKPQVSQVLHDLNKDVQKVSVKMKKYLEKIADSLSLEAGKGVKLEFANHRGYFFRVTLKDAKLISSNSKFRVIESLKEGVRFTNEKLQLLSDQMINLTEQYQTVQSEFITQLLDVAISYSKLFQSMNDTLAHLDVYLSLATLVNNSSGPYTRPQLTEGERKIVLKNSRHPCLECLTSTDFIPNDVELVEGSKQFLLITGPNMGGKSTYLRQVGIICLMAQIGSYVPCDYASLPIIDKIFTRIGTNDYIMRGMSTFMAEMTDMSSIIKNATNQSLILIDELGRGTSTYDGFGLSWAISEHILKNFPSCFVLFATHFHELTGLADHFHTVKNVCLTSHISPTEDTITMLYRVTEGSCDHSFGIHVAKMTGFPQSVINDSQGNLALYESKTAKYKNILNNPTLLKKFIDLTADNKTLLDTTTDRTIILSKLKQIIDTIN